MQEIKLLVDEKNVKTVLSIIENLKEGLIERVTTNKSKASYQPRNNQVVYEEETYSKKLQGKYADPSTYKRRLKGNK